MNAYELAEKLEYDYWHAKANITMFKSADMLRQQADRIAELSKNVDELEEELLKTPQIRERCEPLCKPSVCNCIKKQLNDAIKIIEELRVDADMNYKDYENTYADGWDDAFNNILSALYERHEIK